MVPMLYSALIQALGFVYMFLALALMAVETFWCFAYVFTVWATLATLLLFRTANSCWGTLWLTVSTRGGVFRFFRVYFLKRAVLSASTYPEFQVASEAFCVATACPLGDPLFIAGQEGALGGADAHLELLLEELCSARINGRGYNLMHRLHAGLSHELLRAGANPALRNEICRGLMALADPSARGPTTSEKSDFFRDARTSCGRTALALSPGGPFTLSYFGAIEELRKFRLLPRLLSACGSGALVGAVVALLTDHQLEELAREPVRLVGPSPLRGRFSLHCSAPAAALRPEEAALAARGLEPLLMDFQWVQRNGEWHLSTALGGASSPLVCTPEQLPVLLRHQLGDETFLSAYQKTGRVLAIGVWEGAANGGAGKRFALSAFTTPLVLLYSAVAKSCMPWDERGRGLPLLALVDGACEVFPLDGLASESRGGPFENMDEPPAFFHASRVVVLTLAARLNGDASVSNLHKLWPRPKLGSSRAAVDAVFTSGISWASLSRDFERALGYLRESILARFSALCDKGLIPPYLGRTFVTTILTAPSTPRAFRVDSAQRSYYYIVPKSVLGLVSAPPFVFQTPRVEEAALHVLHGAQATWPFLRRLSTATIVERACAECCSRFDVELPNYGTGELHFVEDAEESCWSLGAADDVVPQIAALELIAARAAIHNAGGTSAGGHGRSGGSGSKGSAPASPMAAAARSSQPAGEGGGEK